MIENDHFTNTVRRFAVTFDANHFWHVMRNPSLYPYMCHPKTGAPPPVKRRSVLEQLAAGVTCRPVTIKTRAACMVETFQLNGLVIGGAVRA